MSRITYEKNGITYSLVRLKWEIQNVIIPMLESEGISYVVTDYEVK